MKKLLFLLWALICPQLAFAQGPMSLCYTTNGTNCIKVSSTLGLPVTLVGGATGSNVNITGINGTAPSLTSPLWVFPATGATFPVSGSLTVSGTVAATQSGTWTVQPGNTANTTAWLVTGTGGTFPVTQSTSPWIVAGGGTAGTAATGVVSVQGIASMTPVQTTLPVAATIAAGNGVVQATSSESGAAATITSTTALASNLVVKGSAGNLYSFEVQADSTLYASIWYIMIFNATSLPSNGAVTPAKCYTVPAATASYPAAFPHPVAFSTGITIGVSTTGCFTLTASIHAFISGDFK